MRVIDGSPGYSHQVLSTLRDKHNNDPFNYTLCSLVIDGMAVKTQLEWDPQTKKMVGFVDLGCNASQMVDGQDEATEALVIMAVGLVGHWKAPIAYFLTNKLTADVQTELVKQAIVAVHDSGLKVVALVLDGLSTNVRMVQKLGCSLRPDNLKPDFVNPADDTSSVFVFFDACHMLKLMRNLFHAYKSLTLPNGHVAHFSHFETLNSVQEKEGLSAANKLSRRHIDFSRQKMKVKLAAQLFSSSTAKALQLGRDLDIAGLQNTEGTQTLCELVDHLFDVLNSRSVFSKSYKAPLCAKNIQHTTEFLNSAKDFLLNIKTGDAQTRLCESARYIGVVGFCIDIMSVIGLTHTFLGWTAPHNNQFTSLKYIRTYRFSQDHLEIFFSCIRQAGGFNNNPSAKQFQAIFKKMMFRSGVAITPSAAANVITRDSTGVELISPEHYQNHKQSADDICDPEECALSDHSYSSRLDAISPFVENILCYICGWIARSLIKKLKCPDCASIITTDKQSWTKGGLIVLKDNGGLIYPSDGLVKIVTVAEKTLRTIVNVHNATKTPTEHWGHYLEMAVLSECTKLEQIFPLATQHFLDTASGCDNHFFCLVRLICTSFLNLRQHHITHITNLNRHKDVVRQSNNKVTLFRNQ